MTALLHFAEGFVVSALVGGVAFLIALRIFVEMVKALWGL